MTLFDMNDMLQGLTVTMSVWLNVGEKQSSSLDLIRSFGINAASGVEQVPDRGS